MRINKQSMLWEELTPQEKIELYEWAESVVLRGEIPPHPSWLIQWFETFEYDERQRLLLISTAVPQRVLLSLLRNR